MDIDDEDDFYAPEEPQATVQHGPAEAPSATTKKDANEELEEGEEEDEGGAMDEDEDSVCTPSNEGVAHQMTDNPGHRHHHRAQRRLQARPSTVSCLSLPSTSPQPLH
jgi:pre-mRNA 3'-end-processing factor FIP1